MDSSALVGWQFDAGNRLINQLVNDGFEMIAAFWVKTAEDESWFFSIASPWVEQKGSAETYRLLQSSLQRLEGIPISLSEVKLVGAESPITRDILRNMSQHSELMATRLWGKQLGNMTIEEAYIYPRALLKSSETHQMSPEEVVRKVVDLMGRSGVLESSTVTLTDGTTFHGLPIGLELINNSIAIKFVADHLRSPIHYPVTQIVDLR